MTKVKSAISSFETETAYESLFKFLGTMVTLDENMRGELRSIFRLYQLKKNAHFMREGERCTSLAYLSKGMVRFYHTKNGEEVTSDFSFEGTFITSYVSLITGKPSDISIEAMEDCTMLLLNYDELKRIYETNYKYERIGRLIAESTFLSTREHLLSLLNNTAEKRYKNLLERAPHFVQKIPLYFIASYLGVSPETLSRIRRKLSIS